jgi:hypothetical protein
MLQGGPLSYLDGAMPIEIININEELLIIRRNTCKEEYEKLIKLGLTYYALCGLMVRVPDHRSRGPGSIPGTNRFSE